MVSYEFCQMFQRSFFTEDFQGTIFDSRENREYDYQHKFVLGGGNFYNVSARVIFM